MLPKPAAIVLLPLFAGIAFLVAYFVFYSGGGYDAPPRVNLSLEQLDATSLTPHVSDEPQPSRLSQGLLVIDAQHANSFSERELVGFASRVADRGYDVEIAGDFSVLDPSLANQRYQLLADKLRRADSFAVILPGIGFDERETALVEQFVRKGGKLLLISDPGRPQKIDGLAKRFGVDFQPDYLYNTADNDANFKRILVKDFQPDQLTAGVESITLDYAGSVESSGGGLAFVSPGTKSSLLDRVGDFSPIAWGDTRNVLAIADFTFLVPTNDSLLDNGRLASNIADFLTDSQRDYFLSDFPYFYRSGQDDGVDILIGNSGLLNAGLQAKSGLADYGVSSEVVPAEDVSRSAVFLGLYEDAAQVGHYLQAAGIRVDDTIGTPFAPELELKDTAVTLLDLDQGRGVLILLADTPETLSDATARLLSGEFRSDLVSDFVAIRKFEGMGQTAQ